MRKLFLLFMLVAVASQAQNPKKDFLVKIKTSMGDMTVVLYDETPLHKANFLKLAQSKAYDSTIFHRVIEEFMIQGGDIYSKPGVEKGSDDDRIPAEIVDGLFHHKGALAAARTNNPEKKSSSCQFYIVQGKTFTEEELTVDQNKLNGTFARLLQEGKIDTLRNQLIELQKEKKFDEMNKLISGSASYLEEVSGESLRRDANPEKVKAYSTIGGTPHLDGEYTVFGKVLDGLDVIDKIAAVKTAPGDKPVEDVYMTMEVIELSKKKITKMYGYTYSAN